MVETESAVRGWPSILPVWVLTLATVLVVLVWSAPDERLSWLGLCFALAIVASVFAQLVTRRPLGFVRRVTTSVGGSVVIVIIAALIAVPTALPLTA